MDARHTLNPFLAVEDADSLIQSYVAALGAELTRRLPETGRPVIHAEVRIGDATIGLTEKLP
ncbi:MAG: VOC family protein, partial [Acidobacteriota bacterium]